MAYKNIEDSRAAIRKHYSLNKESYILRNKLRRERFRLFVQDIKSSSPCLDCSVQYPYYVMDFDHLGDKKYIISKLINKANMKELKAELEKCELVCANCHRMRTHARLSSTPA